MYSDRICTVYAAENGFVVECEEPKSSAEKKKDSNCCMPSETETKTYTAANESQVLKIVREKLSGSAKEQYDDGFKEAVAAKK